MSQKQELGKGIKALIGNFKKESTNSEDIQVVPTSNVNFISLELIKPNARQPRNDFNLVELEELSNSIKNLGLIQPITIRKISDNEYQIISGERRYRASLLAGLKEIPAYIRTANDNEMLEMALVENIQRVDLNPMEIAITYQRLLEEFDITQEKLAERVGKQRSTISNYARLLKLSPEIQNAVKSNKLSMGHARVLVGIENIILQKQLFDKTISEHLSVRSLEQLAQQYSTRSDTSKKSQNKVVESKPNSMIKTLEDKLSASFGSKIQIKRNPKGDGHIIIKFNSDKALNDILDRFDNL
ncbi:MAG: ParB/RepB/Spo0J family partition protein [Saprospiraceae bacterium]